MTTDTAKATAPREVIVDIDAAVFRSVYSFAATNDIRFYLNAIHIHAAESPVLMATDGYIAYCEEAMGGEASASVTVKISPAAKAFLKSRNRVIVEAYVGEDGRPLEDGSHLRIVDGAEKAVFIEPGTPVLPCNYPDIPAVMGDFSTWQEGLLGGFNTRLLSKVMALPGCVRFYHRDSNDVNSSALFTFEPERSGRRGVGLVMPMRGKPLNEVIPTALRPVA